MNVPPNKIQNGRGMPWVMLAHHPSRAAGDVSTWSTSRVSMSRTLAAGADKNGGASSRTPSRNRQTDKPYYLCTGGPGSAPGLGPQAYQDQLSDSGPRRSRISSRTRAALAWPRVAFMTAPTSAPAAATLPARILSAMSGLAAIASSIADPSAASSDTTTRPRAATTSSGDPSPASTPSMTHRASLSLTVPASISATTRATWPGVIGSAETSVPASLARRASSPSHHLRASAGGAPAATVAATTSTAPALASAAMSSGDNSHSACNRLRRAVGGSGRDARSVSTQSRAGASGTRSGSGK